MSTLRVADLQLTYTLDLLKSLNPEHRRLLEALRSVTVDEDMKAVPIAAPPDAEDKTAGKNQQYKATDFNDPTGTCFGVEKVPPVVAALAALVWRWARQQYGAPHVGGALLRVPAKLLRQRRRQWRRQVLAPLVHQPPLQHSHHPLPRIHQPLPLPPLLPLCLRRPLTPWLSISRQQLHACPRLCTACRMVCLALAVGA